MEKEDDLKPLYEPFSSVSDPESPSREDHIMIQTCQSRDRHISSRGTS